MSRYEVCNAKTGKCMKTFDSFPAAEKYLLGLRNPSMHMIGDLKTGKRIDIDSLNIRLSPSINPSSYMDNDDYLEGRDRAGKSPAPLRSSGSTWRNSKGSRRKSSKTNMWKMKSSALSRLLRTKNTSRKERRLESLILSSRRRSSN